MLSVKDHRAVIAAMKAIGSSVHITSIQCAWNDVHVYKRHVKLKLLLILCEIKWFTFPAKTFGVCGQLYVQGITAETDESVS